MTVLSARPARPGTATSSLRAPGLDWLLMLATLALVTMGTLLVWSATSTRADLTGGDANAYLRKQLVNVAIGLVLMVAVMATDHRWVRILAPLAYVASVTGLVLVLVFAVLLRLLPAGGTPPDGYLARPDITLQYLLLPAICLALPAAAALTRFLTESLRTQMRQPYVMTARALGIPRRRIVLTQALRNALPSSLTVLGIQFGTLLGGAVLVEAIFAWPGLGRLVEQGISARDYPVVQVLLLLSVAVFVLTQLLTDVLQATLDPRIRIEGGTR